MRSDRGKPLCHAVVLAPDDIDDRKRQDPLRGFLQRGIEDLVQFVPDHERGDRGGGEPEQRQRKPERQPEPAAKAAWQPHAPPSR